MGHDGTTNFGRSSERPLTYGQRVRRAYVIGLTLVALLGIGSYMVLDRLIAAQADFASVINVSGRQRMLSQRISSLTQALVHAQERTGAAIGADTDTNSTVDGRHALASLKNDLVAAIELMERSHRSLKRGNPAIDLSPIITPETLLYFKQLPHALDERVSEFLTDARAVLSAERLDMRRTAAERVQKSARYDLLRSLDAVVQHYETLAKSAVKRAERLHFMLLLLILLALLAEARWIFAPLVRKLSAKERLVRSTRQELERRSYQDELTGLRNRHFLKMQFGKTAVDGAPRTLIALDLDNFKQVNDTYGHAAGDAVLKVVAGVLCKCARFTDDIIRLGGDEFVIIPNDISSSVAIQIYNRISHSVAVALDELNPAFGVTVSAGVADWHSEMRLDEVLHNADVALYQAKAQGRNCAVVYQAHMMETAKQRSQMEAEIDQVLDGGRFETQFQPQVNMQSNALVGVKALA